MQTPLISNELFRYFFRRNFTLTKGEKINISNEDLDEINKMFSDYLRNKCTQEQLNNFVPKSELEVIMNQVTKKPFLINGFDAGFCLHFTNFVEEEKKKYNVLS